MSTSRRKERFTLLENAFDFILSALDYLLEAKTQKDLKYSILHLSAGLELVLKEKLKQEHWSLVFEKIEKANRQSYESGEFVSVNIDTCIERLEGICKVTLTSREKEALTHLRKKRNQLEHFRAVDSIDGMKAATVTVLSILLDFVSNHLPHTDFNDKELEMFTSIKSKLLKLEEFIEHRMKSLKTAIEKDSKDLFILQCPACYQEALILGDGDPKCRFCYYEDTPNNVANEYLETIKGESRYLSVKDGGMYPLYECPSCDAEAMIHLGNDGIEEESFNWVCFGCGECWMDSHIDFCCRCGNVYVNKDESSVCRACFRSAIED